VADDATRKLVVELRRALTIALKACDTYLVDTSRRPSRARDLYGPDGERGYIAEVPPPEAQLNR
jgi:hypothetical protein